MYLVTTKWRFKRLKESLMLVMSLGGDKICSWEHYQCADFSIFYKQRGKIAILKNETAAETI